MHKTLWYRADSVRWTQKVDPKSPQMPNCPGHHAKMLRRCVAWMDSRAALPIRWCLGATDAPTTPGPGSFSWAQCRAEGCGNAYVPCSKRVWKTSTKSGAPMKYSKWHILKKQRRQYKSQLGITSGFPFAWKMYSPSVWKETEELCWWGETYKSARRCTTYPRSIRIFCSNSHSLDNHLAAAP